MLNRAFIWKIQLFRFWVKQGILITEIWVICSHAYEATFLKAGLIFSCFLLVNDFSFLMKANHGMKK